MKFSDIDFGAIKHMMDNMSDEQKDQINEMAQNMMNNMNQPKEEVVEEDTTIDLFEYLNIEEELYNELPILDQLEQAVDLEDFYENTTDVDFSASVLFFSKAVLILLRKYHFPIYKNVLEVSGFNQPNMTTLYSFLLPLMNEENIHILSDEGFGSIEDWVNHRNFLQQVYMTLNRAEYDFISYDDLQLFKSILFNDSNILRIKNML